MVDICPRCGNYDWDKTVNGDKITCPKCGPHWEFLKLPLFVVTGASGVGKSTTVQAMQHKSGEFVCLESDMLYNLMPHKTPEDYMAQTEAMMAFARDIMQCGKRGGAAPQDGRGPGDRRRRLAAKLRGL